MEEKPQTEETTTSEVQEQTQETNDETLPSSATKDLAKSNEYKQSGNAYYAKQQYLQALDEYRMAIAYCPDENTKEKSIVYSNQANIFFKLKQYEECVEMATKSIELDSNYLKPYVHRCNAYMEMERFEEAQKDIDFAVTLDPKSNELKYKAQECKNRQEEYLESKKKELFGNLKDLGNKLLGNFGMSVDNFKFEKNENGSYNIKFEQ